MGSDIAKFGGNRMNDEYSKSREENMGIKASKPVEPDGVAPDASLDILTTAQVARWLAICKSLSYKLPIPRVQIGRAVRYRRSDVEAFISQGATIRI
jgi:predicted DNA-binding transcriptional regulator AlpA